MESFSVISNELFSIAENLHARVVKSTRSKSSDESEVNQHPPKAPKVTDREIPIISEESGPALQNKTQLSPATFLNKLEPMEAVTGTPVTFRCRVSGTPTPVVRWFRDGMPLANNPDYRTTFNAESGEATLKIDETFREDNGMFSCSAENSGGMAVTEASLNVRKEQVIATEMSPPVFLKTPQDATALEGAGLQFECQVAGTPRPIVAWYRNGIEIIPGQSKITIVPPDTFGYTKVIIPAAGAQDQGIYECKATNPRGIATCSITFTAPSK